MGATRPVPRCALHPHPLEPYLMSQHSLYGYTFEIPDAYAAGHVLTAVEAQVLNTKRGENITHIMRNDDAMVASKGTVIVEGDSNHAVILRHLKDTAPSYSFATRGPGAPRLSPIETEARDIARGIVKEKIAKAGLKLGKRASDETPEETGAGIYEFSKYLAKVEEVAAFDDVLKEAKRIVAQRQKAGAASEGITL